MSKISIQRDYLKLAYPLDGFLVLTSNTNNSYNGGLLMDLDGMTAYKFKPNGRKIGNDEFRQSMFLWLLASKKMENGKRRDFLMDKLKASYPDHKCFVAVSGKSISWASYNHAAATNFDDFSEYGSNVLLLLF